MHHRLSPLIPLALLLACTPERLETPKAETRQAVDNLVSIEADFCTRKPRDEVFPVKVLLVMDASGSLQFLDEGGLRVAAVRSLLSRYEGDPTVSFSIIQFNSFIVQAPADGTFANLEEMDLIPYQVRETDPSGTTWNFNWTNHTGGT